LRIVKSLSAFWALVVMAGFAELGYVTLNISAMPVYCAGRNLSRPRLPSLPLQRR